MDEGEHARLIVELDDFVDELQQFDPGNVTEFIIDAVQLAQRDAAPAPDLLRRLMEAYRREMASRPPDQA